ncbi:RidA family protein [Aestuariirhabdus sp. Z084]|uniref:RidA family protein n=1 Tax=Aestuariirhabdus haliotis TaxID=2918751 RepID=UPI00201B4342|nr:RidA family protein [Aestuariirhabdus haliotis]MCL6416644.1 RidA family protein [Aestuariirhabdus haliotis]MCL6420679.1 RidA family protein [Aestuariirhabdus haliotis]
MSIEKQSVRSGPYKNIFAQAVKVDNVLYLSGQVGIDDSGVAGADVIEQTRLAYVNIQKVLSEFGASLDNIVDETLFVTDINEVMTNAEPMFEARALAYGGVPEVCQTLVQVSALVMPTLKLEIKCVAHL